MKFETSITNVTPEGKEFVRGHDLSELIQQVTFTEAIFLILRGSMPTPQEHKILDAIFVSVLDHGPAVASTLCARVSASAKNSMHTALAAGVLGFGERHGVAVESAMTFLRDHIDVQDVSSIVRNMKESKHYVPGLGHKILSEDHRATALFDVARSTGFFGRYCELLHLVHHEVNILSSKPLPINIDGAIAAILCDMDFDSRLGKGIFMIGRIPGLIAHIFEEMSQDGGIRRLGQDEVEYVNK